MEFNLSDIINENITGLLNEGRLENVKAKYPEEVHQYIDVLSENDPSDNNKYLEWLAKQTLYSLKEIGDRPYWGHYRWKIGGHDLTELWDNIKYFHNYPHKYEKKDINQYKTLNSFTETTEEAKTKLSRNELKKEGATKVYEDDNFILVHPTTHEASCKYGSSTRWCVTMRGHSGYFERYSTYGPLFFLIDKRRLEPTKSMRTPDYYKVAIHYQPKYNNHIVTNGEQYGRLAKQLDKDVFVNRHATIDYWNVRDANVAESTVLKYLGGPGRGQKARGTTTLNNLKNAMKTYTEKLLSDFWTKVNEDKVDNTQKISELSSELHNLRDKSYYYDNLYDQLVELVDYYESIQRTVNDRDADYDMTDEDEKIFTKEEMENIESRLEDLRSKRDRAEQIYDSYSGRISSIQLEINELRSEEKNVFAFYDIKNSKPV